MVGACCRCVVLGRRAVMRVRGVAADSTGCDPSVSLPDSFQQLTRLMQFPEEVALQLTDLEHRLFSRVSAVDYVRLVTSDLTKQPLMLSCAASSAKPQPTVADLILRFQQVESVSLQWRIVLDGVFHGPREGRFMGQIPAKTRNSNSFMYTSGLASMQKWTRFTVYNSWHCH